MIGRLHGLLIEKNPVSLLIDVQGVGYQVQVSMSSFYSLPDINQMVTLWIHMVVREDAMLLYGFVHQNERSVFCELIKVSGIGPRTALAILSGISVEALIEAIEAQESAYLVKVPGIGKKTAERLLLELRGKLSSQQLTHATSTTSLDFKQKHKETGLTPITQDILQALIALGYSEKEALFVSKKIPAELDVSQGIKYALKLLTQ